ncbi:MAG: hypothetical protein WA152_00320 [Microgenomates group bacterium]
MVERLNRAQKVKSGRGIRRVDVEAKLVEAMFADFPQTVEGYLSSDPNSLVKVYDQSQENTDSRSKVGAPVRFYIVYKYWSWKKFIEMPSQSTSLISDLFKSEQLTQNESDTANKMKAEIYEKNKTSKKIYKREKEKYKRRLKEAKSK